MVNLFNITKGANNKLPVYEKSSESNQHTPEQNRFGETFSGGQLVLRHHGVFVSLTGLIA